MLIHATNAFYLEPTFLGFKDAAKDVTLHIAASNPQALDRDGIPEETIAAEREIFAKQTQHANIRKYIPR